MPHIQESHPEPNERKNMPVFDSKKAETPIYELLTGDYPFEIVAVDNVISQGAKTRGSDVRDVKLKFYCDKTFAQPAAQWTESFIAHESTEWKYFVFSKCVGFEFKDGENFDITAEWIGRRGWATCRPQSTSNKENIDPATGKPKQFNSVLAFITNKEKLAPNAQAVKPKEEDDLPPF
jgi:hypothetical protein